MTIQAYTVLQKPCLPFLTEKVALPYTFYSQMVPLSHTLFRISIPLTVNALSLFVNQSQNQNVFSSFHNNRPLILWFLEIQESTFGFMQKPPKIHYFLIQDPHGIF